MMVKEQILVAFQVFREASVITMVNLLGGVSLVTGGVFRRAIGAMPGPAAYPYWIREVKDDCRLDSSPQKSRGTQCVALKID
jgi:hypothetical protein